MKRPHFALPEIYGDSLSYYEVLRELINAMNVMIDNYDTIPEQIADAVKNLDAAQLFSAILDQLIDTIATDNTKSNNAVKVYKKHDLLYATFNETVNLYESIIDFTPGTETELIIGTNIREVNISELFIELRKLIEDETQAREQGDTTLQNAINTETSAREQADTTLQQNITTEASAREQADTALQNAINAEKSAREQADTTLQTKIESKANKSDVLTMQQIQSSINLDGKIPSASALKSVVRRYSLYIESNSERKLNISDLERDREYLLLYTTKNGQFVSGGALLSNGSVSTSITPLSDKPGSSFVFSMNYPNIKIKNNEVYPFDTYISIIG